jgi:hypothetical protein
MVSILMVLAIVVLGPVLLGLCVMLLVYFVHPDDRNEAWIPKIVVVRIVSGSGLPLTDIGI